MTAPDAPQLPVRARALAEGKLVCMAVPRLADERPFIRLDPDRLDVAPRRAASITGWEHLDAAKVAAVPALAARVPRRPVE